MYIAFAICGQCWPIVHHIKPILSTGVNDSVMLHHQSEVIWTCDFAKVSPTNNAILTIDYQWNHSNDRTCHSILRSTRRTNCDTPWMQCTCALLNSRAYYVFKHCQFITDEARWNCKNKITNVDESFVDLSDILGGGDANSIDTVRFCWQIMV